MATNGWHTICGYEVLVQDEKIVSGFIDNRIDPTYVYRWNRKLNCWTKEEAVTIPAFRAGIKRGTIKMA